MTRSLSDDMAVGRGPVPHVTRVEVLQDYVVRLEFDDGFVRVVDLGPELRGPVFEPLRDPDVFRKVAVDREIGTIVWPNGADLAPEFLRWGNEPPS
jgi:hypothetical protein